MYRMECKGLISVICIAFSGIIIFSCKNENNKDLLMKHTVKVTLANNKKHLNVSDNYLDSIVYLYSDLDDKGTIYVSRTIHTTKWKETDNYYLYITDSITYVGIENHNMDTIFYQPYYLDKIGITCRYDFKYLEEGQGKVVRMEYNDSEIKKYNGDIFLMTFLEPPTWFIDKNNRIIKIAENDFLMEKVNECGIKEFPTDYREPVYNARSILCPMTQRWW